jgi:hypothetical protein
VNSLKTKFFSAVARLESSLVEFGHPRDQHSQTSCHLCFAPLVLDLRGEQKFVHPLRLDVHIHQEPYLLRVLLVAFEDNLDVLLPMVAVQR